MQMIVKDLGLEFNLLRDSEFDNTRFSFYKCRFFEALSGPSLKLSLLKKSKTSISTNASSILQDPRLALPVTVLNVSCCPPLDLELINVRLFTYIMIKFVPSKKRGKSVLIYDGFRFKRNKTTATIVYFQCTVKDCRSRLTLHSSLTYVTKPPSDHNHAPQEEFEQETKVVTGSKLEGPLVAKKPKITKWEPTRRTSSLG